MDRGADRLTAQINKKQFSIIDGYIHRETDRQTDRQTDTDLNQIERLMDGSIFGLRMDNAGTNG
jgi:hypothetical protein